MPTYEYRCNNCGHELEAFQKITEPALKLCPECNQEKLERLISGGNFVLRGGGWAKDNYGSRDPVKSPPARGDGQQQDRMNEALKKSEKESKEAATKKKKAADSKS
jgi:putative FmdB family regulatory protein